MKHSVRKQQKNDLPMVVEWALLPVRGKTGRSARSTGERFALQCLVSGAILAAILIQNCARAADEPNVDFKVTEPPAELQADVKHRQTAPALKQAPVDFNHPPREYVTRQLHGWSVLVEKQLAEEAPELAESGLARLEQKLGKVADVLPVAALPDLRKLKIFLMYGPNANSGGRNNGLEYFRATAPEYYDWLDPKMGSSIVIYHAENYAGLSELWALKSLVHEFGHAQHLEHWPEDRADIYDTWDNAMEAGLYQVVREEDRDAHFPNYAAQNHLEYFAELTAMYFVGANYFPKDRAALKVYDPAGYALVQKLWGIRDDPMPQTANSK